MSDLICIHATATRCGKRHSQPPTSKLFPLHRSSLRNLTKQHDLPVASTHSMATYDYDICPSGDFVLTIKKPAHWQPHPKVQPASASQQDLARSQPSEVDGDEPQQRPRKKSRLQVPESPGVNGQGGWIAFRLSSATLSLASSVIKAHIDAKWVQAGEITEKFHLHVALDQRRQINKTHL
ncbi:hypothetical protein B0T16DRAFT_415003 [Cercophora newfieldiana]|uniref:Uncharacterized protein n=1 Tax=Cercophora newfieldiana TaxID=92897 RepID=A0AA39Y0M1_9PEZI|nr:hypothetical protein B0T16DRAFT_415003 [Cercophora newfieldiana]